MKNFLKTFAPLLVLILFSYLAGVGIREKYEQYFVDSAPSMTVSEKSTDAGWQLKKPFESAEYIEGPLVAATGELCVFRLSDKETKADWVIVPPATCYIDSSGSSLAFASNVPSKYTIIAAIVEEGVPKILTHVCEYGVNPKPVPKPNPSPSPTPIPSPTPQPVSLGEWIKQNVPDAGRGQCAALGSCYEAAADGIEKGTIKSPEAAFSLVRTATQTKIKIEIWGSFLEQLAVKVTEKLDGSNDVKKLGAIFSDIASALRAVSDAGDTPEDATAFSEALKLPSTIPVTNYIQTPSVCTDPTGRACQPQTTIQYRRSK